jgi:hypothetical protein
VEPDRLPGLHPERHDVLDLEVDRVADPHAVPQAVVAELDRGALDADHLAHERSQRPHRPTELAAEDLDQLVELLVARLVVDVDPEPPVPLRHHLRGVGDEHDATAGHVGALHLTGTDVERQSHPAEVVRGPVVEREVARTHQLARAGLDVAAGQVPRHHDHLLTADRSQLPPH